MSSRFCRLQDGKPVTVQCPPITYSSKVLETSEFPDPRVRDLDLTEPSLGLSVFKRSVTKGRDVVPVISH